MPTFVVENDQVTVPPWVVDLKSFRRWVYSDEFPEAGRICFFNGEVWVDMSREQFFSHNQVKGEYNVVLGGLAKKARLGRWVPDGMLLTNEEVGLCCQPDGAFYFFETRRAGKIRLREGALEGMVELQGSPDMVLEVVSTSSVGKDTDILFDLYWQAGIREYWLVDVRGEDLIFEIYRPGPHGYVAAPKQGEWVKSGVFKKSFRLLQRTDEVGDPEYVLKVRN